MIKFIKERNRWEATVYMGGRRIRTYHETKKEAQNFKRDAAASKAKMSGMFKPYSFEEAFASYLELDSVHKVKHVQDADARFLEIARYYFESLCHKKFLAELTLEDLQRFEAWMRPAQKIGSSTKEPWGNTTVHMRSRLLKSILRKAFLTEKIPRNPGDLWRVPRGASVKRRPMSPDEYAAVYKKAPAFFRPVLEFLRLTGARGASVAALTWADVDFARRTVLLRSRKGGVSRLKEILFPLYPALYDLLHSEFKKLGPSGRPSRSTDPVFWGRKGKPITAQDITTLGSRLIHRCGFDGLMLYGLRHAIATELTEAGVPLEIIRQVLGHSKLEQTSHYASGISLGVVGEALNKVRQNDGFETPHTTEIDAEPPDLSD